MNEVGVDDKQNSVKHPWNSLWKGKTPQTERVTNIDDSVMVERFTPKTVIYVPERLLNPLKKYLLRLLERSLKKLEQLRCPDVGVW